ncbi:hypothetical protein PF005_g4331 [Phytophthora fragariae]|uniref:Uncharacterized protein n=2 Tax=Phytophthora TaxID=4783 RepID=A0A6A3T670_9STRA|nr:hypothetical protein PF003_g15865 [Phytophthora fragariae]KAE9041026.1 hypothetical protein PR002_g4662 [Phytophthora rubi]KAE8946518.1 hypothetical protein PF009_g3852 [Phytophthora fragariae]KAE9023911.1 hypothetical protein PF011_g3753 [Phytophthora fragariae]KAE9046552.1 hypothetical protein PR001_g4520 [Phytophthora rubi]
MAPKQNIEVLRQQHSQETMAPKQDIAVLEQQHAQDIATFKKLYVLQAQEMKRMKEQNKKTNSALFDTERAIEAVTDELKTKDNILLGVRNVVNALVKSKIGA